MEDVRLMDRMDLKFIFSQHQLPYILSLLKPDYDILETSGKRQIKYQTRYYDTSDFKLYHHHHQGKLNRFKVRYRQYENHAEGYLEIKHKNNKGRTIKSRVIQHSAPSYIDPLLSEQLKHIPDIFSDRLFSSLEVTYQRITFIHKQRSEKITFDYNLTFINNREVKHIPELIIAEIKQNKKTTSKFVDIMKNSNIKASSISKYCLGLCMTQKGIKKNNFKALFSYINRIIIHSSHDITSTI